MMKNILFAGLSIFLLGNLCHFGLPWWGLAPIAALIGWFVTRNGWVAFLSGFLGGFLLWYAAGWFADNANESMLATKVGHLFMGLQAWKLLLVTGFLGGLLAGMSALTGTLAKSLLVKPSRKRNYLQERRR